jgi:GNAT superfamily N-acetyltransferase
MLEDWFRVIRLPLSLPEFHRLPRNPAYKYEYIGGVTWLSPRPKFYSAKLDLTSRALGPDSPIECDEPVTIRPLEDRDWRWLTRLFSASFSRVQPFTSLSDRQRIEAARSCLKSTREGRDGPLIRPACFVALDQSRARPLGAILVTLVPPVDLDDFWSLAWKEPPPAGCIERREGHAHLTWIFVAPLRVGHGVGSALLNHAVAGLRTLGYSELISTFLLGNESSMLWHWRNGFELLSYAGSLRRFRAMMRASQKVENGGGTEPLPADQGGDGAAARP